MRRNCEYNKGQEGFEEKTCLTNDAFGKSFTVSLALQRKEVILPEVVQNYSYALVFGILISNTTNTKIN